MLRLAVAEGPWPLLVELLLKASSFVIVSATVCVAWVFCMVLVPETFMVLTPVEENETLAIWVPPATILKYVVKLVEDTPDVIDDNVIVYEVSVDETL